MDSIYEQQVGAYTARVVPDYGTYDSPRDWDNVGIMECAHRRYDLGDVRHREAFELPADAIEPMPLYLLEHGGVRMSTGDFRDPWDSGQVGWIYTTRERLAAMGHDWTRLTASRRARIREWLRAEVDTYDAYLAGAVYAWEVVAPSGEVVESCGGYIGWDADDYALSEAVGTAEAFDAENERALALAGI